MLKATKASKLATMAFLEVVQPYAKSECPKVQATKLTDKDTLTWARGLANNVLPQAIALEAQQQANDMVDVLCRAWTFLEQSASM